MTDFLEQKTREISERLEELRPYVDEFNRLEAAHRALAGVTNAPAAPAAAAPRRANGGGGGGAGRPKGSGTRSVEALEAVRAQPGITIPELAQRMGIQQNYLYRVLPGLEQEGQVRKEGRGWFPAEDAAAG
jgi:predicted Rossmann fold nucleotide-binding protein DprA/Smf involved in DNA uptake